MVVPFIGTLNKFFLARLIPFLMADKTSGALPKPTPTPNPNNVHKATIPTL